MCVLLLCLSGPTWQGLAQFVDVTAEINTIHWLSSKAVSQVSTVQCVVGMDSWQIREEAPQYSGSTYTNWFTGSHFIERSRLFPQGAIPDAPPPEWVKRTNIVASVDGNPSGLLLLEARLYQYDWKRDGSPVGIYTWAREAGAKLRPWYDGVALLLFFRLYVCWLFRAPSWIHEEAAAHRSLNLARSLFWLLVVELIVCKALM